MSQLIAFIRGIIENPAITEINVRSGPGTSFDFVCKAAVGTSALPVVDVQADAEGKALDGKTYQWLSVTFADGQAGWVRDDLAEIVGDGTAFGYGMVAVQTHAFALQRVTASAPVAVAQPAAPVPMAPAAAPLPTPAAAAAPAPDVPGICTAYVNMRDGANARSGPGTSFELVTKVPRNATFEVQEVQREAGGAYLWARGSFSGQTIWMREDLLRFEGVSEKFGLGASDVYPAPMRDRWWVRGFEGPDGHWGWDFGATVGEPVFCGPQGGLVVHSVECSKCAGGRSFKSFGLQLSDRNALNDPAWNFGYGHYVIVRYLHEQLPHSTQQRLAQAGLAGAHLFVMYAHLHQRTATAGQTLAGDTMIGTCGDTGNSEAPHLHLEIRAALNPNETNWATMKRNLLDPTLLFGR